MINTAFPTLPIDLDGKPAFGFSNHTGDDNLFEVGDDLSGCVSPRRECTKNYFKKDIWVPHINEILNNSTLPTGASTLIAKLMKIF